MALERGPSGKPGLEREFGRLRNQSTSALSRSLLDSLSEAKAEVREGAEPELLEREKRLKQSLNKAGDRQEFIPAGAEEELQAINAEIQRLTAELEQVKALIRTRSPAYAALTQPRSLALGEIQEELLDGETILLEYTLGERRSFVWVMSENSLSTYTLPSRRRIEESVLALREHLTSYEVRPAESVRDRRRRIREAKERYWAEAAELSEMLLGPVKEISDHKRLLIVSDGALHYLPFASLPVPNGTAAEEPVPLVVEHEVVRLPSASTLAALRSQTADRPTAEKWVAVLADPVLDATDPRFPKELAGSPVDVGPNRTVGATGGIAYPRLPSSRFEAESIAQLAPAGKAMMATGFDASREAATSSDLGEYRVVHFATHSILHQEHPELSGVVLSMFDAEGRPRQGLLRLHDIYNLRLPVDLVVLSACDSYLGKQVRGEGLMGIVRGFMYAGASRVLASLWKVDDLATKELMVRFYENLFGEGQSPAAALRNAQIAMWEHPKWSAPYHWAAFVLQGEWR